MSVQRHSGVVAKLRATFGPALAGLAGGALAGLASLPGAASLGRSVALTYSQLPGLGPPALAALDPPGWALAACALAGLLAPVGTGALAAWLAAPRDAWEDLS